MRKEVFPYLIILSTLIYFFLIPVVASHHSQLYDETSIAFTNGDIAYSTLFSIVKGCIQSICAGVSPDSYWDIVMVSGAILVVSLYLPLTLLLSVISFRCFLFFVFLTMLLIPAIFICDICFIFYNMGLGGAFKSNVNGIPGEIQRTFFIWVFQAFCLAQLLLAIYFLKNQYSYSGKYRT